MDDKRLREIANWGHIAYPPESSEMARELLSAHEQIEAAGKGLEAADRMVRGKYVPWTNAGGPNECRHGRADGIPCYECDRMALALAIAPPARTQDGKQ